MDSIAQYEFKISGRVQGVWFRRFVQEKAKDLDIKGWVKNTVDGGVLVMAQGYGPEMDAFTDWLHIGPPLARVLHVEKTRITGLSDYKNFGIKY
jgi:acylphosphatase